MTNPDLPKLSFLQQLEEYSTTDALIESLGELTDDERQRIARIGLRPRITAEDRAKLGPNFTDRLIARTLERLALPVTTQTPLAPADTIGAHLALPIAILELLTELETNAIRRGETVPEVSHTAQRIAIKIGDLCLQDLELAASK